VLTYAQKGWELYVGWNDQFKLAGKPFKYNISATIGDYISKITRYNNPDKLISDYYEGMTLGEIWGYKVSGLFRLRMKKPLLIRQNIMTKQSMVVYIARKKTIT